MKRDGADMDKREAWNFALGLRKIDGLKPSDEFLKLVAREIGGEITDQNILEFLHEKYNKMKSV